MYRPLLPSVKIGEWAPSGGVGGGAAAAVCTQASLYSTGRVVQSWVKITQG